MTTADHPRLRGRPPSGGRDAILNATLELLRDEGVSKLTSRAVAAHAGVSDASVYYHFGDREGLLRAAFAHSMKPLNLVAQAQESVPRSQTLAQVLAALEQFFDDVLPILHAAQADAKLGTELARYLAENDLGPHKGVRKLANYLRGEQSVGRANPNVDPEGVALMLIDAAFGRASRRLMLTPPGQQTQHDRIPPVEVTLELVNQLLEPSSW
jgi:AcrR family transcriptional regulator